MALKKLTPIEKAICTIDEAIRDLKLQRQELIALLPQTRKPRIRGYLKDPLTGKKFWWDKKLEREYLKKKKGLETVEG